MGGASDLPGLVQAASVFFGGSAIRRE